MQVLLLKGHTHTCIIYTTSYTYIAETTQAENGASMNGREGGRERGIRVPIVRGH